MFFVSKQALEFSGAFNQCEAEMEANKKLKVRVIVSNIEDCFTAMNRLIEVVNGKSLEEKIPYGMMDVQSSVKTIAVHFIGLMERLMVKLPEDSREDLEPDLFRKALNTDATIQKAVFYGNLKDLKMANEFLVKSNKYCTAINDIFEKLIIFF